jgi:hypothetical protein
MSKKIPSKDDALEALDFIVSVLKEHEKDLDRLINELGSVTEKMGDSGELSGKMERVEGRLTTLQNDVANLIAYLSVPHEAPPTPSPHPALTPQKTEEAQVRESQGPPLTLRCKRWEDFQEMASGAQTLSYLYREPEKTFQADAVKGNQVITYSGQLPEHGQLVKAWLSKQLNIPEKKVLEGVLAVG